jgi:hypothetical protein
MQNFYQNPSRSFGDEQYGQTDMLAVVAVTKLHVEGHSKIVQPFNTNSRAQASEDS